MPIRSATHYCLRVPESAANASSFRTPMRRARFAWRGPLPDSARRLMIRRLGVGDQRGHLAPSPGEDKLLERFAGAWCQLA